MSVMLRRLCALCLCLPLAAAAHAQEDDSAGFDAAPVSSGSGSGSGSGSISSAYAEASVAEPTPSAWSLDGILRLDNAARISQSTPSHVANLRQTLELRLGYASSLMLGETSGSVRLLFSLRNEADAAYLMHWQDYDAVTRDTYAWGVYARENFLAIQLGPIELSFGRQIVNFGQAEMISTLDLVNPRDLRFPLQFEPSDVRLPVLLSRLSLSLGSWRVEGLAVHEAHYGLLPPPLSEWSPLRKLLLSNPAIAAGFAGRTLAYAHRPEQARAATAATQAHVRVSWVGTGVDIAFHASSLLDGLGVTSLDDPAAFAQQEIVLEVHHPRYFMLGNSGTLSLGSFLIRWEARLDQAHPIALRRIDRALLELESARYDQLHGLIGLTYAASSTTTAAIEISKSFLFNNPARVAERTREPLWPVEEPQIALRFNHQFWGERATLQLFALWIGALQPNAWAARAELEYLVTDDLSIYFAGVIFRPSERFGPFFGFEHNERVFAGLRWNFSTR